MLKSSTLGTLGPLVVVVVVVVVVSMAVVYAAHQALSGRGRGQNKKKRFPPGPAGVPVLGNYFQLSTGRWNDKFTKWTRVYGTPLLPSSSIVHSIIPHHSIGDIVFAYVPGSSAYVINSSQMAQDTLGKGIAYAGRPYSRMTHAL